MVVLLLRNELGATATNDVMHYFFDIQEFLQMCIINTVHFVVIKLSWNLWQASLVGHVFRISVDLGLPC